MIVDLAATSARARWDDSRGAACAPQIISTHQE